MVTDTPGSAVPSTTTPGTTTPNLTGNPAGNGPLVGPPAPTPDSAITSAADLLKQIVTVLAVVLLGSLTPTQRKRVVKVRRKAQHLIPQLISLAIGQPAYSPVGTDPKALEQEWELLSQLLVFQSNMSSTSRNIEDTVLQKEADLWKAVLTIYKVAAANVANDPSVVDLVNQVAAALAQGPRNQKTVHASITPTPTKGKKAKDAALAGPKAHAVIPGAAVLPDTATPSAPSAPAPVSPVTPTPTPISSGAPNGAANGSAAGPGH